jgi:DNA-binding Lrp family transcriptional regulator
MSRPATPGAPASGQPARPLDEIDRRIVEVLRSDGRVSMTELAERVRISRANAYSRFSRLEDEGVIDGFGARVDPHCLGMTIAAVITITAEQQSWAQLRDELVAMAEVDYFALTAGEFDILLLVRAPDVETLRDVILVRLQNLPEIRTTRTILVLDEVMPARSFLR